MRKTKTRCNLIILLILSLVMVTLVPLQPAEARVKHPWVVLNKGTEREVVCVWSYSPARKNMGRYDGYHAITLKQARQKGTVQGVYPVRHISTDAKGIPHAYAVAFVRPNSTALVYRPLQITREHEEDGAAYIEDCNGERCEVITDSQVAIFNITTTGYMLSGIIDDKKQATTKVNGIKAIYKNRPKQACINAFVTKTGADRRYFLQVESCHDSAKISDLLMFSSDDAIMPLEPKCSYDVYPIIINYGKTAAKNVRLKLSKIPKQLKKGEVLKLAARITGDNLTHSPVRDTLEFVAMEDVSIEIEPTLNGSYNLFGPKMLKADRQYINSLFSKQGRLIGEPLGEFDQPSYFTHDGIIPAGGEDGFQYVNLRVEKLK